MKKIDAKLITSCRLDQAAVGFAADQLMMRLGYDDPGHRARAAWLELQRAARAFVHARRRKKR